MCLYKELTEIGMLPWKIREICENITQPSTIDPVNNSQF